MPYITQEERKLIDGGQVPTTEGQLNYRLCTEIKKYLGFKNRVGYTEYNQVIGVLHCLANEIYRRKVAPYEDIKIAENGDVFD